LDKIFFIGLALALTMFDQLEKGIMWDFGIGKRIMAVKQIKTTILVLKNRYYYEKQHLS